MQKLHTIPIEKIKLMAILEKRNVRKSEKGDNQNMYSVLTSNYAIEINKNKIQKFRFFENFCF